MVVTRPSRRSVLLLWLAGMIGALCVLPYTLALAPGAIERAAGASGLSVNTLLAISLVQSGVLLALMVAAGSWACARLGLGTPLIDAWTTRQPLPAGTGQRFRRALLLGLGAGVAIVALDYVVFMPADPGGIGALEIERPAAWKGLLASFYGGITEEIQLRFFLLAALALSLRGLARLVRAGDNPLPGPVFWTANLLAALLFGLGHLPATAELLPLTPLVIARALLLNGLLGVLAGYLFRRDGLESAMTCHFAADLLLHVALPLLG